MIVMKFGGTSVQDAEAIQRVIGIVKGRLKEKPLVVVSAMAKVTRMLVGLAEEAESQHFDNVKDILGKLSSHHRKAIDELLSGYPELHSKTLVEVENVMSELGGFAEGICMIGELSARSRARIISTGEVLSSVIVSAAMNSEGVACNWADARTMLVTDENYLNARPDMGVTKANIQRIIPALAKGADVIVTQGFIATSASGFPSVLGFEGSDYSAAIFGSALAAERVEIWTDVDGIRTADPRIVSNTQRIGRISYAEAAEMAYLGARVLHPMTIEPAKASNIPIYVLNSRNPQGEGTVVGDGNGIEAGPKSIACRTDIDFLEVSSGTIVGVGEVLSKVLKVTGLHNLSLSLVSVNESQVSFTLEAGQPGCEEAYSELSRQLNVKLFRDKAQISTVGKDVVLHHGLMNGILSSAGNVSLVSQGPSMMNVSFVVDRSKASDVASSLHGILFGEKQ